MTFPQRPGWSKRISLEAEDELLMILGSADASDGSNDQRFQISPNVYAADASLDGGGAYVSALCPRPGQVPYAWVR